jgi:hypothetical protein
MMRRGFGRRMFGPDIPPLLQRANQMMANGNYVQASSAFEQLARAAEARGGPRAPFFYIQAGRARVMAGQTAGGLEYLERGLGLFAARNQRGEFGIVGIFQQPFADRDGDRVGVERALDREQPFATLIAFADADGLVR